MSRRVLVVVVIALAACLAGCGGIPTNASVQVLPSALLSGVPNVVPPQVGSTSNSNKPFEVYYLKDGKVSVVLRPDPSASRPASTTEAIEALNDGPDSANIRAGYTTALSAAPGAGISYVGFTNGAATINLNNAFILSLIGVPLYQAFGQIVATLSQLSSGAVHSIAFVHDGITWPALLPDGETVFRPVGLCDYASIEPAAITGPCHLTASVAPRSAA